MKKKSKKETAPTKATMKAFIKKLGEIFARPASVKAAPQIQDIEFQQLANLVSHIPSLALKEPFIAAERWRNLGNIINDAPQKTGPRGTTLPVVKHLFTMSRAILHSNGVSKISFKQEDIDFVLENRDVIHEIAKSYRKQQYDLPNVFCLPAKNSITMNDDPLPFNYYIRQANALDQFMNNFQKAFGKKAEAAAPHVLVHVGMPRGGKQHVTIMSRNL